MLRSHPLTVSPLAFGRRTLALGVVLTLVSTSSGCSYLFSRGPQTLLDATGDRTVSAGNCTTSTAPAVLDAIVAAPLVTVSAVGVGVAASDNYAKQFLPAALLLLGVGVAFTVSAGTGFARTADCRKVKQLPPTEPGVVKQDERTTATSVSP